MKRFATGLLKGRITRRSLLAAALPAAGLSVALADDQSGGRVKLAGTWVGKLGDITWTSTFIPDSSGQSATVLLQWITVSADFEALFAQLGADSISLVCGYSNMVSKDTATGQFIWYGYANGIPSLTHPVTGQIKTIDIMSNELRFTSPTAALGKHELKIYAPDPQAPMVPNEANCFFDQTYENVSHVRIF